MITLLTRQDMAKVFTMAEAVQAAKDALALYSAGDTDIPLRANLPVPVHNGSGRCSCTAMPPALPPWA